MGAHIALASRLNTDEIVKTTGGSAESYSLFPGTLDRLAIVDCETEEFLYEGKWMRNH